MCFVRYDEERFYVDPNEPQRRIKFPSLTDEPTLDITVIVPSKDEEKRLPKMLDECLAYLNSRQQENGTFAYEVIVVDDGSVDATFQVALDYSQRYGSDRIRVLKLRHNRGKGGAVRLGVICSRGRQILFADADGATRFSDLQLLEKAIADDLGNPSVAVAVGSRAHLEKESIAHRSFFRTVLMFGFHLLVWLFCVRTVRDTQCGFKLFTRTAAATLFPILHMERWAFDVELLFLAERLRIPIAEVAVNWHEVEGSKLNPLVASFEMGLDIVMIWLRYTLGTWQVVPVKYAG
uniref:Dolichyl-phosphate beta-glucosyltransferase n=1 Tax=Trichuris muris TaxID=70415 RepID=A0A5S6QVP3_TRIMR